jgi:hypothetical protein
MPTPLHQYASVPVAASATEIHRRLRADVHDLVAAATADALTTMGRQAERWGLRITQVPVTAGRATEPTELGSIEVGWVGREDTTGWPALTGRLAVVPSSETSCRLLFVSPRSPRAELATGRLDRLHRQRLTHVSIQRFLHYLARQLSEPDRRAKVDSAHVESFDSTPMFVHHLETLAHDPAVVRELIMADLVGLAERATTVAVERARGHLTAGRFRAPAAPTIQTRPARPGEPASVWIGWRSDEEATGWPNLDLTILVEAHDLGSRLLVLSPREPGYDLSVNRSDKQRRNQILARAGADLAEALHDALAEAAPVQAAAEARPMVPTTA